jgi:hypothetical protein
MPSSIGFNGNQFSTLQNAGLNDREGLDNYDNTEVKYGATFYGTWHLLL